MCPRCRSTDLSRSRSWRFSDVFAGLFGMKPFRCRQCMKRFYLPSRVAQSIDKDRDWLHEVQEGKRSRRHRTQRGKA
jgi:hypothetical protein